MNWCLKAFDSDIAKKFPIDDGEVDRVYSICTIEHLTSTIRRFMMREVGRVLKTGGVAAITMCYDLNHKVLMEDKGLRFAYWQKIERDVVGPSGMGVLGRTDLTDFKGKDFLGILFLKKK